MQKPVISSRTFEAEGFQVGMIDLVAGERMLRLALIQTPIGPVIMRLRMDWGQGAGNLRITMTDKDTGEWEIPGQELGQKLYDLGLYQPPDGNLPDDLADQLRGLFE